MNTYSPFEESRFETKHEITINGKRIPFCAVAEDFVFCDASGAPEASLFSYSYTKCAETAEKDRPVIFVWNGGPGCSGAVENLRFFSPWRVKNQAGSKFAPITPPYELEANPNCILDICDVVIIDPVGTGFGRLLKDDAAGYYSVDGDAKATALFIESWLTANERWNSPRYLAGTSYGSIRCARTLEALQGGAFQKNGIQRSIPVNGVVIVGAGLFINENATSMLPEGVEPTLLLMRSMAAIHAYHEGREAEASAIADEAANWGRSALQPYYENGGSDEEKRTLAEKMSAYTGLPVEMLLASDLKVSSAEMFAAMVLATEGKDVGIYDARMTLPQSGAIGVPDPAGDDPGMGVYTAALTGVMNGAMREKLGITDKRRFVYQNYVANFGWNYAFPPTVVSEIPARTHMQCLAAAMRRNPRMQVLLATGLYDLCTWAGTNRYAAENCGLPAEQLTLKEYPGGHMVFSDFDVSTRFAADIRDLIRRTK